MKIREEIAKIRREYDFDNYTQDLFINKAFIEIWYEKTEGKKVILYGAGGGAKLLVKLLIKFRDTDKIEYIVDKNSSIKNIWGIPVKNKIDKKDYFSKIIWITPFEKKEEIKRTLLDSYGIKDFIDPYEELSKRIQGAGDKIIFENTSAMRYKWFSNLIDKRDKEKDRLKKQELSRKLIAGYFSIYDWVELKREIERYSIEKYSDTEIYSELLKRVEELVQNIKSEINKRSDDIIIFIIDSLANYVTKEMPLLEEWKRSAYEFAQYKCLYPGTREIFNSFFTGWMPFEHETFRGKPICYESNSLLTKIKEENYEIKLISQDQDLCRDYEKVNTYSSKLEEDALISEVFFNGIMELVESNKRQIILMHTDITVHYPHATPYADFTYEKRKEITFIDYKNNFIKAVKYTDDILHAYSSLLDENKSITKIVMGDHGIDLEMEYYSLIAPKKLENCGMKWNSKVFDTELIVKSEYTEAGVCNDLISSSDFWKILENVVDKKIIDKEEIANKVVPIEWVPGWDYQFIMRGMEVGNYYFGIGAKGCRNKNYFYISTESGENFYYRIEEENVYQLSEEEEIKEAIDSLGIDEIKKNIFSKDVLNHPVFEDHNRIYYS